MGVRSEVADRGTNRLQPFAPALPPVAGDEDRRLFGPPPDRGGSVECTASTASMEVLPVTWMAPPTRSARRLAAEVSVGANRRWACGVDGGPIFFFGPGREGSWVLQPCLDMRDANPRGEARERRAQGARRVALDHQQVRRDRRTREKRCRDRSDVAVRVLLARDSPAFPSRNAPSPKPAESRSGCWPVRMSEGANPRSVSAWATAPA